MRDTIYSETENRMFAVVDVFDVQDSDDTYEARLIEDRFPEALKTLFQEFNIQWKIDADNFNGDFAESFAATFAIRDKIALYKLKLVESSYYLESIRIYGEDGISFKYKSV